MAYDTRLALILGTWCYVLCGFVFYAGFIRYRKFNRTDVKVFVTIFWGLIYIFAIPKIFWKTNKCKN